MTEQYPPSAPTSGRGGIFTSTVETKFVYASFSDPGDSPPAPQMRVEVEVEWQDNSYTTTGFVAGT